MYSREATTKRNRTTLYLLLAGGAVLVIPLLILLYLRFAETASSGLETASHPFASRESVADRIKAAQTPAPSVLPPNALAGAAGSAQSKNAASATVSDSLGFIKIMGIQENGSALLLDFQDEIPDCLRRFRIQVGRRLIHE